MTRHSKRQMMSESSPPEPPTILIFGAAVHPGGRPSPTLRARTAAARSFGAAHPDARYIPTGALGRHPPAEARVMAELLARSGVPPDRITPEPTGTDTLSSVLACVRLLRATPAPVRVATSAYHLPRCLLLLRLCGIPARACPPPPDGAGRWFWRLREAAAIPWDVVALLWELARRQA